MSTKRRDLHKSRLRRDRIRREKHAQREPASAVPPAPELEHPFAAERSLHEIEALLEGQTFNSVEEANARIADLTRDGRLLERANLWKQEDPKWRAQQLAYDALETDDLGHALRLVHDALELDPDCTDAQRLMVSLSPVSLENRIQLMREVVEKAERNMGESFFSEHMGRFWGTISTRPYMRAKQHLGELLAEAGRLTEAIPIFERMLELNPNDDQVMRYPLLGLYLATGQTENAGRLLSGAEAEEGFFACLAWARVLERWLSGKTDEAETALARARGVNSFAEQYLSGARPVPEEMPAYYRPGGDLEAQVCAHDLAQALKNNPGFGEWLKARR